MIYQIIEAIKDSYKINLIWADLVAGIAKTVVRNINATDNKIISKKFPVYENDKTTCSGNDYTDLVPDSNRKSIIYFTDQGTSAIGCSYGFVNYETTMRCVAWVNLKKINKTYKTADILMADIMSRLPKKVVVNGIAKINITLKAPVQKSVSIFSEYSYSEEQNQYLMYPFDYFAFDFLIQWSLPMGCEQPILDPDTCK